MHCFSSWPKNRKKGVPTWLSTCFYQWINIDAGKIGGTFEQFAVAMDPLIEELHQKTPDREGLDRQVITGMIYDDYRPLELRCVFGAAQGAQCTERAGLRDSMPTLKNPQCVALPALWGA